MSFFTSSSNPHRHYVMWLLALSLVSVSALFALGIYLQPLYGDLTRVGFYAEKDFGWNKPQSIFPQPLSTMGQYDRYHDVVVLGDSFSTGRPELHWQNYLGSATGWSVVTLDINKIKLDQVLVNSVFRKTPPKVFILELVERDLPLVLKQNQTCDTTELRSQPHTRTVAHPNQANAAKSSLREKTKPFTRPAERKREWNDINVGYVRGYIWHGLLRQLLGDSHTRAQKIDLARPAPFSSRDKHSLLVFRDDITKVKWWRDVPMTETGCRIEAMHGKIEANQHTQFVFMAAPDKLTAYAEFVSDKNLRNVSALAELSSLYPSIMPRLDLVLKSAIQQGQQDIYLPNDTHWGTSGNMIVGMKLLNFLQN